MCVVIECYRRVLQGLGIPFAGPKTWLTRYLFFFRFNLSYGFFEKPVHTLRLCPLIEEIWKHFTFQKKTKRDSFIPYRNEKCQIIHLT